MTKSFFPSMLTKSYCYSNLPSVNLIPMLMLWIHVIWISICITYYTFPSDLQAQTIRMMYEIIGQELKSKGLKDAHPTHYLNFYCLVNRELLPKGSSQPTQAVISSRLCDDWLVWPCYRLPSSIVDIFVS